MDIEHRRDLVSIFGVEGTGREDDIARQVGVDEAHALLLRIADQEGSVYLYVVDKDEVFIVVAAPHVVLRTQLVGGVGAGQHLDDRFHAAPWGRHLETQLGVDAHVALLALRPDGDHLQRTRLSRQDHGQVAHLAGMKLDGDQGVPIAELLEHKPDVHP